MTASALTNTEIFTVKAVLVLSHKDLFIYRKDNRDR